MHAWFCDCAIEAAIDALYAAFQEERSGKRYGLATRSRRSRAPAQLTDTGFVIMARTPPAGFDVTSLCAQVGAPSGRIARVPATIKPAPSTAIDSSHDDTCVAAHLETSRANGVTGLALNEASIVQILQEVAARGIAALAEFLYSRFAESLLTGDYSGAAVSFVDYWGCRARSTCFPRTDVAETQDAESNF